MKRLVTILLIIVVALATQDVDAKRVKRRSHADPLAKLVEMIAAGNHWSQPNLAKLGLTKLISKVEQEEFGESEFFVYGKNATATVSDDGTTVLTSTGPNAYAIEVVLTTDNGTAVYFKEKADHDKFMNYVRKSRRYKNHGTHIELGSHIIENDDVKDGWYVVTLHGG